jgi:hypothetical protein
LNGFIYHLNTPLGTTSNYSATTKLHNLQITKHSLNFFQPAVSSLAVPWQQLLKVEVLPLHSLKSFLHRLPYRTDLVVPIFLLITHPHGPHRNTHFPSVFHYSVSIIFYRNVFTEPLPRNGPGISAHFAVVA